MPNMKRVSNESSIVLNCSRHNAIMAAAATIEGEQQSWTHTSPNF